MNFTEKSKFIQYTSKYIESLTVIDRQIVDCLNNAGAAGDTIIYDQNNKYNLTIKKHLEFIYFNFSIKYSSNKSFILFEEFLFQFWYFKGIYDTNGLKLETKFNICFLEFLISELDDKNMTKLIKKELFPLIFSFVYIPKKDSIFKNFYYNVNKDQIRAFYNDIFNETERYYPFGFNSRLTIKNKVFIETLYKQSGLYDSQIRAIILWLKEATSLITNEKFKKLINYLVEFYVTGDADYFFLYIEEWIESEEKIGFLNGFIENYSDFFNVKCTWESIVYVVNDEEVLRSNIIRNNITFFLEKDFLFKYSNFDEFNKAKLCPCDIISFYGDCLRFISTGKNLPNQENLKNKLGSKSLIYVNVIKSYLRSGFVIDIYNEFCNDKKQINLLSYYDYNSELVHVYFHEYLGHGTSQFEQKGEKSLLEFKSILEETRADLASLYFLLDDSTIKLKLLKSKEMGYSKVLIYLLDGLIVQLRKVGKINNLVSEHMISKQLIANWCYYKYENLIEKTVINGNVYFKIDSYQKLQVAIKDLFVLVERIMAFSSYEEAKLLVDTYGSKIDKALYKEVKRRLKRDVNFSLIPVNGDINNENLIAQQLFINQNLRKNK